MNPSNLVALIMRHGTTELNEQDVLKGFMDPQLDEKGLVQATDAGTFIADNFHVERIFSSPLLRAYNTSRIVDNFLGNVEIIQTRELFPWNLGTDFMNVPKKGSGLGYYVDNPDDIPTNGESLNNVFSRVRNFFAYQLEFPFLTLFVTHNSILTTLADILEGKQGRQTEMEGIVEPGGVCGIYREDDAYTLVPLFGKIDGDEYAT